MAKPRARIAALQIALVAGTVIVLGRAAQLQIVRGGQYARQAVSQRTEKQTVEPRRGSIKARDGTEIASVLEYFHVGILPQSIRDTNAVMRLVREDLRIKTDTLRKRFRENRYFYAHGPFTGSQVERLRRLRGVDLTAVYRRTYPGQGMARPLLGSLFPDSAVGASGLERFLDPLLRGVPGEAVLIRDGVGKLYESPGRVTRHAVAGNEIVLTIDSELQSIAEAALDEAFHDLNPDRGDILFLDPRTGEILAAASRDYDDKGRERRSPSFFLNAFEPGSTAKPFTAAALLADGKVQSDDVVTGENGKWVFPISAHRNRTIPDDHPIHGPITLGLAIQRSSNIGMGKFSTRLTPAEHYDALRKFGFGSETGVEFPAESPGRIARPQDWKPGQEGVSMAMGYGLLVTPIQLAQAYGALANGGVMLAPSVIKEVRGPDGRVIYRHRPTVVRRVIPELVAKTVLEYLARAAADSGTGSRAQVQGGVLGKTGTAKLVKNGRYVREYAASFAGIFPANHPQLVVTVRIENPRKGSFYGGFVAAPIVAKMLRRALATRHSAIDRTHLDNVITPARTAEAERTELEEDKGDAVLIPIGAEPAASNVVLAIPEIIGLPVRGAALALHRRGFQVRLDGTGYVLRSDPAPGDSLAAGQVVAIHAAPKKGPP
ncbi:MAG: penicillin-binding transpeptidase domain-containing protein [Gemmatimonadota bacterium]